VVHNLNSGVGQNRQFTCRDQPANDYQPARRIRLVLEGATATFTWGRHWRATLFITSGMEQWYQLTDGGNISGSTSTSLTINSVSAANVGTYTVIVTNVAEWRQQQCVLTITRQRRSLSPNQSTNGGCGEHRAVQRIRHRQHAIFSTSGVLVERTLLMQKYNVGADECSIQSGGQLHGAGDNLYGSILSSNAVLTANPPPTMR